MRRYRCEARIKKEARSLTLRSHVEQRRGQSAISVRLTMMRLILLRRNATIKIIDPLSIIIFSRERANARACENSGNVESLSADCRDSAKRVDATPRLLKESRTGERERDSREKVVVGPERSRLVDERKRREKASTG